MFTTVTPVLTLNNSNNFKNMTMIRLPEEFQNAVLNVNGKEISSNELTYDDLVWLYNDYIKKDKNIN